MTNDSMEDFLPQTSEGAQVDWLCDRFEADWKSGKTPSIEQYLKRWPGDPGPLLSELLPLELELRRMRGETPELPEYLQRFPMHPGLVRSVFNQVPTIQRNRAAKIDDLNAETADREKGVADTAKFPAGTRALKIRCPHCHNPVEILDEQALTNITCPSCQSAFSLAAGSGGTGSQMGRKVGHFELIEQLGAGAFGAVWKARDTQLERTVAVKIPRRSQLDAEELEKFVREARAAAQLKHPHIVSVHEVGREGDTVYIVSDYIAGLSLDKWLEGQKLTPRESVALCRKIALALHHAHEAGVIHRDLKPSNIMIDAAGDPHVMDFGLAKREAAEITMTVEGQILGTPAYMSPEQAQGDGYRADRRSDVYSLGVILFELLTGERPFRGDLRMMLKQVVEDEPPSPRKLDSRIERDLETICLKCLEKQPERRYATTLAFAEELARYERREPIQARPISRPERAWRWCQRNPVVAGLSTAVLLVLSTGIVVSTLERNRAVAEELKSAKRLYYSQIARAQQSMDSGQLANARDILQTCRLDFRGWEHDYLHTRDAGGRMSSSGKFVAFSPDGKQIVSSDGTTPKVWDASTCEEALILKEHTDTVECVAFSPDGQRIVGGSMDNTLKIWDASTGEGISTLRGNISSAQGNRSPVISVAFSPNSQRIVCGCWDHTLSIWDASSGKEIFTNKGHTRQVTSVAFSPDGQRIVSGSWDQMLKIWDASSGEETLTLRGHSGGVNSVEFNPIGKQIVSGSSDGTVRIWDATTGMEVLVLSGHEARVTSVAFSPDGQRIVSGSDDQTLKVWDASSGKELFTLKGHTDNITSVAFSPDGQLIVSASWDNSLKLWHASAADDTFTFHGHSGPVNCVAFSPDGKRIVSGGGVEYEQGEIKVWDTSSGKETLTLKGHASGINFVDFSPDGRQILSGGIVFGQPAEIKLWNVSTGEEALAIQGEDRHGVRSVAFSPDGKQIAGGAEDDTLKLWNSATGVENLTLKGHAEAVLSVAFSPDGRRIVSGSRDSTLKVWDALSGEGILSLRGHTDTVTSAKFSPDGLWIVSISDDRMLKVWNATSGEEIHTLKGHADTVNSVAFSPDGQRIVSGSDDRTLKVWDASAGEETLTLKGHTGPVLSVAFSPDGQRIVSGSADKTLKVWDASLKMK